MDKWHPDAIRVVGQHAGSMAPDAGPGILHHTTEGSSAGGAIGAYRATGSWPHFTFEWTGAELRIYQHIPLDLAGRALVNGPEPGETNRARKIQIEHVGFAASSEDWSDERCAATGAACRWIERQIGSPAVRMPGTTWGTDHPSRLGGREFHERRGHAAHQHVPGNIHWDWGQGRISAVLEEDDTAHRVLRRGAVGADVTALQRRLHVQAAHLERADLKPDVDGVFGPDTARCAAAVAYLLGLGKSRHQILANGLSVNEQRMLRRRSRRTRRIKTKAAIRQRAAAKRKDSA
jgi:hypothetical protein